MTHNNLQILIRVSDFNSSLLTFYRPTFFTTLYLVRKTIKGTSIENVQFILIISTTWFSLIDETYTMTKNRIRFETKYINKIS